MDGNGRIGRLWQQLILMSYHPIFEFLSVESLIKKNQKNYYRVLGLCDKKGESTLFLEFMLKLIYEELTSYYSGVTYVPVSNVERLHQAQQEIKQHWFSRKDYMKLHKTIAPATASRDIHFGLSEGMLEKEGDKRT